jgi:predicted CXXCH cytochrome family protein
LFLVLAALLLTIKAGALFKAPNPLHDKYSKKNVKVEQQCKTCHNNLFKEAAGKQARHLPFANWYCTDCHLYNEGHLKNPANRMTLVVKKEKLCVTCHLNITENMSEHQHEPWRRGFCTDCHNPHYSEEPKLLRTGEKQLCASCHRLQWEKSGLTGQHVPFNQGDCSACHSPHASEYRGMTRFATGTLCAMCHRGHLPALAMPYKHGPFARQECTYCHDPHAAAGQSLLSQPLPQACYRCHPGILAEAVKAVPHGPVLTGLCKSCHQPHGALAPNLLSVNGCTGCHITLQPVFTAKSRHPVDRAGFSCTSCHRSHGADNRYLLDQKGNNVCAGCHLSIVQSTAASRHNGVTGEKPAGDCLNCHAVHYSDQPALLPAARQEVCGTCHRDEGLQAMDVSHGNALRQGKVACADCHDPHGRQDPAQLLKQKGNDLCRQCHNNIFGR